MKKQFDPRSKIAAEAAALVENIRSYVRSQKELWQLVPWLALEADGRDGHSDSLGRAFRFGVWAIESCSRGGNYTVYVDLASGELINPAIFHYQKGRLTPADDSAVLELALALDELDASRLVKELQKEAKKPHASCYQPSEKEAWRRRVRSESGLKPVFTADQRPPVPFPSLFD